MQHNFDIPNQQGAEYRADVNRALQALATLSSGPVAPAAPYPHMLWMDTSSTPPVLRRRSADNTFWQVVDPGTVNSYFKRNADGDVVALSPEELAEELTTAGRLLKVGDFGVGQTILIPEGADLNDYITPGEYRQNINANASPELNYPVQLAGSLKVIQVTGNGCVQEYTTYGDTRRKFLRGMYNGSWSGWVEFYHTGNVADLISGANLVPASRTISTGTGLTGGGNLSANRTISLATSHFPIGVGQTWQNVKGSRSLGTTYTNTTGRPIMVSISLPDTNNKTPTVTINVGGVNILVNSYDGGNNLGTFSHSFIVPAGATYRISVNDSVGITTWAELR